MNSQQFTNNFNSAKELDATPSVQSFNNSVNSLEQNNLYRLSLNTRSSFNLNLDELTQNLNVELFNDEGKTIAKSAKSETKAESISRVLEQGNYLIRVFTDDSGSLSNAAFVGRNQFIQSNQSSTLSSNVTSKNNYPYKLSFWSSPVDQAGNNLNNPREIGVGTGNTTVSDWVGNSDNNDFYRFRLNADSNFSLKLNGLSGNADVELLNSNGNRIQLSNKLNSLEETINNQLGEGVYYVRVFSNAGVNTNYNVTFSASPDAGSTLATAREINVSPSNTSFKDSVSVADANDLYRFNVANESFLNLRLNGLSSDANLQLLDNTGKVIFTSSNTGNRDETITRQLSAGSYFARVFPNGNINTNYNLNIWTATDAGNSLNTARQINVGAANTTFTDWVGVTNNISNSIIDTDDYYRFSLNDASQFSATLNNLSANADLQLLNNAGEIIQASINGGTSADTVSRLLSAGTYFIRVSPTLSSSSTLASTNYNLNVLAAPVDNAGNTLNTAAELNLGTTNLSLREWVGQADTNDFYRFTLNNSSHFNVSLSGLTADINLQLLDSRGNQIQLSNNSKSSAESITRRLDTGTYFIRVTPNGNSNSFYNLNLSTASFINGDWTSQNLSDPGVINSVRSLAADGQLSRLDTINILRSVEDGDVVDAAEIQDLRTIVGNTSRFRMQDHVRVLANKVVNGDLANQRFQNRTLGNLVAGSSDTQMENLINKWFFGSDRPRTKSGGHTYQYAQGSLFQNGVSMNDVRQGDLGTCYLIVSLGTVAEEKPRYIQEMFIDNGDDTYTVRFLNNGVADYVTVDRFLPVDSSGKLVYARKGDSINNPSNELWVALAEKAYAQINESGWIGQDGTNSYAGIEGGWMGDPKEQITGGLTDWDSVAFIKKSEITALANSNKMLTTGFYNSGYNVYSLHSYIVTSYDSASDKFSLFNPWGFKHAELNWEQMSDLDAVFVWSKS
jgi:Calpain family cysteine protease/Bacterial pre-peptidase C-terminal domain